MPKSRCLFPIGSIHPSGTAQMREARGRGGLLAGGLWQRPLCQTRTPCYQSGDNEPHRPDHPARPQHHSQTQSSLAPGDRYAPATVSNLGLELSYRGELLLGHSPRAENGSGLGREIELPCRPGRAPRSQSATDRSFGFPPTPPPASSNRFLAGAHRSPPPSGACRAPGRMGDAPRPASPASQRNYLRRSPSTTRGNTPPGPSWHQAGSSASFSPPPRAPTPGRERLAPRGRRSPEMNPPSGRARGADPSGGRVASIHALMSLPSP